jgi:hypothetical protein
MTLNELPKTALGAAAQFTWVRRYFALAAWLSARAALGEYAFASDGSLRTQRLSAALLACPRLPLGARMHVGACVGPEFGSVHGKGVGLAKNRGVWLATYGALARLDFAVRTGEHLRFELQTFVSWNLAHKRLVYEREGERHTAYPLAPWAAGAALGLSRSF